MNENISDDSLIIGAKSGNKNDLEELLKRYRNWIFNTALAFTADRDEAADITQEVLIKILTHLSTFKGESSFKTWVYRIVKNHFLNMKRSKYEFEQIENAFQKFADGLDEIENKNLPPHVYEVEEKLLVKEAEISCMRGMLLCLDREQRMIFILGELFEFPDSIGGEIMEISKENFRVKLHRAKQQLYNFMDNKCGLINKKNPCRCAKKTIGFIKMGCVNPIDLLFQKDKIASINSVVEHKLNTYDNQVISDYQKLFQLLPFQNAPENIINIKNFLSSDTVKSTFNLE